MTGDHRGKEQQERENQRLLPAKYDDDLDTKAMEIESEPIHCWKVKWIRPVDGLGEKEKKRKMTYIGWFFLRISFPSIYLPLLPNNRTLNLFVGSWAPDKIYIFLYYFQLHLAIIYRAKHWLIKYKWKCWDLLRCFLKREMSWPYSFLPKPYCWETRCKTVTSAVNLGHGDRAKCWRK